MRGTIVVSQFNDTGGRCFITSHHFQNIFKYQFLTIENFIGIREIRFYHNG